MAKATGHLGAPGAQRAPWMPATTQRGAQEVGALTARKAATKRGRPEREASDAWAGHETNNAQHMFHSLARWPAGPGWARIRAALESTLAR